ncbi:MAG: carboxypeptidase regulatory-like domain-containing protein [Aeromicrobium sp.]
MNPPLPTTVTRRPIAGRLVVPVIAALSLLFGPLAFLPAQAATFTISGTVQGEDGEGAVGPVADAVVKLEEYDPYDDQYYSADEVTTDEAGAFTFGSQAGSKKYRVRVAADGFASQAFVFTLTAKKTLAITLTDGGTISGHVAEAGTDALVPGAFIRAFPWDGTDIDYEGRVMGSVDEEGNFVLEGVAPGSYKVQVDDWDGVHVMEYYNDATDVASAATVAVREGDDTALDPITLAVGASFTGKVVDDGQGQVVEPAVFAYRMVDGEPDYSNAYQGHPDDEGSYTIGGLPAGDYKISLSENTYHYFDQFYPNKPTIEEAVVQPMELGDTKDLGTAVLERSASVTGVVMKSATSVFQDALVEAHRVVDGTVEGEPSEYRYSDENGEFRFRALHAGTYRLKYRDGLHRYKDQLGPEFKVAAGGTFDAGTVTMVPVPKVAASVTVSGKGGTKKATLTIKVTAKGVTPTGRVTVKLGSKTLKTVALRSGRATVALTKQKKGKRVYKVIYAGDSKVLAKTVNTQKITIK